MNDTSSESNPAIAEPRNQKPKAQPSGRPAHQILERLFQLHPKMFGARFLPLKLGVFHDLMALHQGEFTKDELKAALGVHARSTRYLEAVASGAKRHDLDALPVEDVAPEHVHHAIMEVFRRRQARSKQDLRPWLHSRLVNAIEASGLGREEYTQRVATHDPTALAALDEAFAELAQSAARREALKRAFAASGKSIEEFADMYGMKLAEVRRALSEQTKPG
jgi:ProP effector